MGLLVYIDQSRSIGDRGLEFALAGRISRLTRAALPINDKLLLSPLTATRSPDLRSYTSPCGLCQFCSGAGPIVTPYRFFPSERVRRVSLNDLLRFS
jgi:hypothetical protein